MAIIIKTAEEIAVLREGGKRLAALVRKVSEKVAPGVSTAALEDYARVLVAETGDQAAFLGYTPEGAPYPFPAALCISVNDEVVHGLPGDRILKEGDIVSVDGGLKHGGLFTDHAVTVPVGKADRKALELIAVAAAALEAGIAAVKPGARVGDVSFAIQSAIKPHKFGIIKELSGHGVGRAIHEDPYVPNYGRPGTGALLKPGMVIAIEPMITLGSPRIAFSDDGYTITTADGSYAAHQEHTVLVTETGAEVLTKE